jgi:thioredoxin
MNCGTKNRVDPVVAETKIPKCGKCGATISQSETKVDEQTPLNVTDASFQRDVTQITGRPVLVDAWAPWCGPCRMVGPIVDQLAAESRGRYRIAKLNVDENPRVASHYQIQSIPTMLIFKNGKLIDRLIGAQSKQTIASRLAQAEKAA